MIHGRVIGELWATVKLKSLDGRKLLIVRPEGPGPTEDIVAVDLMGAGRGDRVVVALGRAARNAIGEPEGAVEAAVIAIVDEEEEEGAAAKPARKKTARAARSKAKAKAVEAETEAEIEAEPEPEAASQPELAPEVKTKTTRRSSSRASKLESAVEPEPDLFSGITGEATNDLFGDEDEPEEILELVVETDQTNEVPGFEDVDAIWGDDDDDETRS